MALGSLAVISHHSAEGAGRIQTWCEHHGYRISYFMAPENELPQLTDFDALVILGGPADVVDCPAWMQAELELIAEAVKMNMPVLGICLGAQLLATTLGGKLYRLAKPELGWLQVMLNIDHQPHSLMVPQWHFYGIDFTEQKSVQIVGSSERCRQQVFKHKRQFGVQFHPEWDEAQIQALVTHFKDECPFVSKEHQSHADKSRMPMYQQQLAQWFFPFLDNIFND